MPLLVREVYGLFLDQLEHLVVVLLACVEGWESDDHLVSEDTECPPVDGERMASLDQNLWRQIIGCATERVGLLIALEYLCETEICQTNISVLVHENVLRLQVTIDNLLAVKMAESHGNLDCVETRPFFWESCDLAQVGEKFTTSDESHYEEHFLFRLENVVHAHQKWVISLHKNVLLQLCRLNLVVLDDNILAQGFHGVGIVCASLLHKEHLAERAATND